MDQRTLPRGTPVLLFFELYFSSCFILKRISGFPGNIIPSTTFQYAVTCFGLLGSSTSFDATMLMFSDF